MAIAGISSAGSTNMESGLKVGYELAEHGARGFNGRTRVFLFTDERPNVGNTHAEGFIAMAREASHKQIGLTTIGVGVQFGAELANGIAGTRGGNLFFIDDDERARELFGSELDYMVSEVAHDLRFQLTPQPGYEIAGVYGVPSHFLTWRSESVVVDLPTVFLSKRGGGLFLRLRPTEEIANRPASQLLRVAYGYTDTRDEIRKEHSADIVNSPGTASENLRLAALLVDEHVALVSAAEAFHYRNDLTAAYRTVNQAQRRLASASPALRLRLTEEIEALDQLRSDLAALSGHGRESASDYSEGFSGIWRVQWTSGEDWLGLEKDTYLHLGPNWAALTDSAEATFASDELAPLYYDRRRIVFLDEDVAPTFRLRRNSLFLNFDNDFRVRLIRISDLR